MALLLSHRIRPRLPASRSRQMPWMSSGPPPNDVVSVIRRGLSECASGRSSSSITSTASDQQRVVIAAPARDLHALDSGERRRIRFVHGVGAHAQRAGERDIHPCLEVRPGSEVVIAAAHRLARRLRPHVLPADEVCAPFGVQRIERAIALPQPFAHPFQGTGRQIEIEERGEIGNAGLVAQAVIQRMKARLFVHGGDQAVADTFLPHRIGKARIAPEHGLVIGVLLEALLRLDEAPIHLVVGEPAMIGRIEVGRDVLDIPGQTGGLHRRELLLHRRSGAVAVGHYHGGGNAELLQRGIHRLVARLPLDDLVVVPRAGGQRAGEQRARSEQTE